MSEEIKEILEKLKDEDNYIEDYGFRYKRIALDDVWHLLDYITNLQEENERLNNIINELEKGLRSLYDFDKGVISKDYLDCVDDTLEKLQELKGSDNNDYNEK